MANEVEIVITASNRGRPAVEAAKRDAEGLGKAYKESSRTATSAIGHVRDALTKGLYDAVADVNGETNRMGRAWRTVSDGAASSFSRVRTVARERLSGLAAEVGRRGREAGSNYVSAVAANIKSKFGSIQTTLTKGFRGGIVGVLSTPVLGPLIGGVVVTAAAALGPSLGALIAGSLVTGIGAGLVGLGIASLFNTEEINSKWSKAEQERVKKSNEAAEKLKAKWRETWRDITSGMREAAQPLLPFLETVRSTLTNVGREFKPVIEQAFKIASGPLRDFTKHLGKAFLELKPAVEPLMGAFGAILDEFGPMLPGAFSSIADSLINLATVANENRDMIAMVFTGLIEAIPIVIDLVSGLASSFRGVYSFMIDGILEFLALVRNVVTALGNIPGLEDWAARTSASLQSTIDELSAYQTKVDSFPRVVELEGDIRGLEAKIAKARSELNDPNLTKKRRAKLEADIKQLLAAKRRAQAEIDSLRGKTVYLTVRQVLAKNPGVSIRQLMRAHGGIIGGGIGARMATGGVSGSGAGSTALVGEQGPELVRLPFGSTVVPAGQTRNMLSNSGFGSVSMAFRPGGSSGGGAGDVASGLRDVASALREIVTLRDGVEKLTGGIFGQERALQAYYSAWSQVGKSLKENGKTLRLGTEKGRENRAALMGLAEAAHDVLYAMRDLGKPTSEIVKKIAQQRLEFIRAAKSMGLTTEQAKKLADRYGLIPKKVKTILDVERRDTAYNRRIEKRQQGRAAGGPAGGWTLVGERGRELVRLPYGSSVVPNGGTESMLAGGSGPVARAVIEVHSGGSRMDDLLVEILRRAVRERGGDVQDVLGRGGGR